MDTYSSRIIPVATIIVQVCFGQENMQQEPLLTSDFRQYALNMGGTLVDLLRKEISLLSKISPTNSQSTPPSVSGDIPPANTLLSQPGSFLPSPPNGQVPPVVLLPDPIGIHPQMGNVLPVPALPGIGIPAGISASAGSTVYSFGTNSAPVTVINVYGDLPPNATLIAPKSSQLPSLSENTSENPSSTAINNSEASFQEGSQQTLTGSQNQKLVAEELKNGTSSNQLEESPPVSPEQSLASNSSDSTNTQNTNDNMNDVTSTVPPETTPSPPS